MAFRDFAAMVDDYLPDRGAESWRDGEPAAGPRAIRLEDARKLPIQARLDLHGLNVAEARKSVDRFLRQGASQGLVKVLIIHGKGSGTLRQEIRRYLEGHPLAGHREPAPQADGGQGAMIVLIRKKTQGS